MKSAKQLAEMLNLKEEYDFGNVAYLDTETISVLLYNDSEQQMDISFISSNTDFSVIPQSLELKRQQTMTVQFQCKPRVNGELKSNVQIVINQTPTTFVRLVAQTYQLAVDISPPNLTNFKETLITQTSAQQTVLTNISERPINYRIMQYPTEMDGEDPLFDDPNFQVGLLTGVVYPNAKINIQVHFTPTFAGVNESTLWIDCSGRFQRIPVQLRAIGKSPNVDLDVDVLEYTNITLGASSVQTFQIRNFSDIQAQFQIVPRPESEFENENCILEFSQEEGNIPPQSALDIQLVVTPLFLGEYTNIAKFQVIGGLHPLILEVKTTAVPPTVQLISNIDDVTNQFDKIKTKQVLDFGITPYGFGQSQEVTLKNTSCVTQEFTIKVEPPRDSSLKQQQLTVQHDFTVTPQIIMLDPDEQRQICITLLPKHADNLASYRNFRLHIYNKCQELPLAGCAVHATVVNASFKVSPATIDLPQAFVGYEHKIQLNIENTSRVVGRWLFTQQDMADACMITSDLSTGVIASGKSQVLNISLIPRRPGALVVAIKFLADAQDSGDLQTIVQYDAKGPQIKLSSEFLKFQSGRVLEPKISRFTVTNVGFSKCKLRFVANKPKSFFTIKQQFQDIILDQNEARDIEVDFLANQPGVHKDQLLISSELADMACDIADEVLKEVAMIHKIRLQGEAKGTPLVCPDQNLAENDVIDCGQFFTTEQLQKVVRIENHGPEEMTLNWAPASTKADAGNLLQCTNNKIALKTGEYCDFEFIAKSKKALYKSEQWLLRANVAGKSTDVAFTVNFQYRFVQSEIAISLINEDNTETPIDIGKQCKPLDFIYEEFPVFGSIEEFFDEDNQHKIGFCAETDEGQSLYINAQTLKVIKIQNMTQLNSRLQVIVQRPFFVQLVNEKGEIIDNGDALDELNETDFGIDELKKPSSRTQVSGKWFESFLLTQEQCYQYMQIGIEESFVQQNKISKNIDGNVIIRLLPPEQNPANVPTIKLPVQCIVQFPSCEYGFCGLKEFQQYENVDFNKFFDKLEKSSSIDFGSTVPGTPINKFIYVKNISSYPIQFNWEVNNFRLKNCQFDISPSGIIGDQGLLPQQIAMFKCMFTCDAGEQSTMKIEDVAIVCNVLGGPVNQFTISAQISNLAVDVLPSHFQLDQIQYNTDTAQTLIIQNQSDVTTIVQLKTNPECLPFIKKINDKTPESNIQTFDLKGFQKLEIPMVFAPRVPGRFHIPLFIKIGHLEEVMIPVQGTAYIEQVSLLTPENIIMTRSESVVPWEVKQTDFKPFSTFLRAAYTMHSKVQQIDLNYSSLEKIVNDDGSIDVNGQHYDAFMDQTNEQLSQNPVILSLAETLVMTAIERYKCQNVQVSNRVVSKARNRVDSSVASTYVNDHNYKVIRTEAGLPKYMTMFNCVLEFPSCQRGVLSTQTLILRNTGAAPASLNFDKKYFFSYGINVEPERIGRLPPGEQAEIVISYQPPADAPPDQLFLIPFIFKSNTIGFIQLKVTVSTPSIKVTNLLNLVENFQNIKIKQQDVQILHFGECKFGRQLKFGLNIDNPTSLQVNFSCDISGGSVGVWDGSDVDLKAKIQTKSPDLFKLESTPQQQILPFQQSILNIAFTPLPLLEVEVGKRLLFIGILKLNVKSAMGGYSSQIIYLVGLGYYPAITLEKKQLTLPAVFPGQISQEINILTVKNDDKSPLELYVEQFDDVWRIERLALDCLAQLEGTKSIQKHGKQVDTTYTLQIPNIADAGELFSTQFVERLEEVGAGRLVQYLKKRYAELRNGSSLIQQFINNRQAPAETDSKARPKSSKKTEPGAEAPAEEEAPQEPEIPEAQLASELLMEQKRAEKLKELNVEISPDDFSYELTESEKATIGYQKSCFSVINDKSYRIDSEDVNFSNLPFLTFIVSGAPLSGKSGLCKKIQQQFKISNKNIPILNIDVLLINSEVEKKYLELKEKQNEEEAAGKGKAAPKKGEAPPVDYNDYKNIPEYVDEIIEELITKIEQLYENDEGLIKIGCIFDQPENNQFLTSAESLQKFFNTLLHKFNKKTLYDKQVATSRHAIFPIILDITPLCARKRAMDEIIHEYRDAEANLQHVQSQNHGLNINKEELEAAQLRIQLTKTAMVDAKQYYDIEFEHHEQQQQIPYDDFVVSFNKVYCDQDILGQAQAKYLEDVKALVDVYSSLKQTVIDMHKQLLIENKPPTDKSELETQIDAIQAEMDQLQEEMSKQKNKAQLKTQQDKYDELQTQITELREKLPPNPVDLLPELNLFQKHVIQVEDHPNLSELDQIFDKYITPLKNYAKVLKQTQIFKENPHYKEITCVREYQIYKALNPMPINDVKQLLEQNDENNEIIKILDEKQGLKSLLVNAYENLGEEKEVYQLLMANSHYIDYFKSIQTKIDAIQAEIDELEGPPPTDKNAKPPAKSKEQLAEIAAKQKEIQQLQTVMSADSLYGQATQEQECGMGRYIIQPGQTQNLYFRLLANQIKVDQSVDLTLKSRTTMIELPFQVVSTCDWPHIVPQLINVKNQLVDFGFLRSGIAVPEPFTRELEASDGFDYSMDYKKFCQTMQQKVNNFVQLHTRELLIENDSKYKVNVAAVFGDGETPAEELQKAAFATAVADPKGGKAPPPAAKKGKDAGAPAQCFQVYPPQLTLEPGQKQYIFVTAFPQQDGEANQQLYVFTEHNPSFQELNLKCIGCQPAAELTVPECQQDLLPCSSLVAEVNELSNIINGMLNPDQQVDPKAKKAPPAKGAPVEVSKNLLNIQRTAISQMQSQEIIIKNTSDLQLYVLFDLAENIGNEQLVEKLQLKKEENKFTYTNTVPKKQDKDQTIYYDMANKYLQIKNYKFVLLPQEERKIIFHYQSADVQQLIIPGQLQVFQINKKYSPVECQLEPFTDFAKLYGKPIIAQSLIVVAEASKVEVVTEFVGILTKSEDIIPAKDNLSNGGFVNFGTVKAMLHYQAEFNLQNIGKYDVKVNATIRKPYLGTVTFCEQGPKDPKAKGDVPVEMKDQIEFVLGPGAPAVADAGKDKKGAAAPTNNTRSLVIDYFSQRGLERSAFADLVLSDAASGAVLQKIQLHGTAKCSYASLSITPDRSLYFGDVASGRSVTRNITLENTGDFSMSINIKDVQTSILNFLDPPADAGAAAPDRKTPAPKGGAAPPVEALVINQFSITPTAFSLGPGEKQQLSMTFNSLGTKEHKEYFVIEYSNRNPNQGSNYALPDAYMKRVCEQVKVQKEGFNVNQLANYQACNYGISGYSQVPGIKPDINEVFEEQQIVNQAEPDPTLLTGISQYSINANQVNFGAVQLNSTKYERIKLHNPFNVECQFVAFLTQTVENASSADLITQTLGNSLQQVMQYVDNAPTSSRPATGKKPAAPAKGGKGEVDAGDAAYWTLSKAVVKIPPRDSAYLTVGFKPDDQRQSQSRLIATSIDQWLRVQEQLEGSAAAAGGKGGKPDPNAEKNILTQLTGCMTEADKKSSLIDVRLIGAGVMPEVRVKPQCIQLDDHMVGYSDVMKNRQGVSIVNVGRIACSVSLQIKAEGGNDQYFMFVKSDKCSKSPENRLFTGLIKLQPEESYEVDVALSQYVNVLRQNQQLEATVVAKILLAGDDSNGLEIPVNASVIVSPLCIEQKSETPQLKQTFIQHATQCLFQIPDGPGLQLGIEQILKGIGGANAFSALKTSYLQTAGVLNEEPLYAVNVFLTDVAESQTSEENKTEQAKSASAASQRPQNATFTELELFNQSSSVQRFDLGQDQLQKLGVFASPIAGHVNPGQKVKIQLCLTKPAEQPADPKAKGKGGGGSRTVLFGTPLMVKITPIQLQRPRQQAWNDSLEQVNYVTDENQTAQRVVERVQEPPYSVVVDPSEVERLRGEYDEISATAKDPKAKAKLTPQQQGKLAALQKIFEENDTSSVASNLLQLNLFGTYAPQVIKLKYQNLDTKQYQDVAPDVDGIIQLPLSEVPILQSSNVDLKVMNDGICCPVLKFVNEQSSGAITLTCDEVAAGRPDLLAVAVKETYATITDIPSLQALFTKLGLGGKGADKNLGAQLQQKYTNIESSPFSGKLRVQFKPVVPGSYQEQFNAVGLPLNLSISANATLPICHVEGTPSKYLEEIRPSQQATPLMFANLMASAAKSIKVVQIGAVGVNQESQEILTIVNTINATYEIQLSRLAESSSKISCDFNSYTIVSGEKVQVRFGYTPDRSSFKTLSEEAFYILRIPAYEVQIPILVAGVASEPKVTLSTNKAHFGRVELRGTRELDVKIINDETQSYNWKIDVPNALKNTITVRPTAGIVPAKGEVGLVVMCQPKAEESGAAPITINVAKKSVPLTLNVKYECAKPRYTLQLIPEEEMGISQLINGKDVEVSFGRVFVADSARRRFKLTNVGQAPMNFSATLRLNRIVSTQRRNKMELQQVENNMKILVQREVGKSSMEGSQNLEMSVSEGSGGLYDLQPQESCFIDVTFQPREVLDITKQFGLQLDVHTIGLQHQFINLIAKSVRPGLQANVQSLSFPTQLANLLPEKCQTQMLTLTNYDKQPLNVEFNSESDEFCIITEPAVEPLLPGRKLDIVVRFQPLYPQKYTGQLNVVVNGLYKLRYTLTGTAVECNIAIDKSIITFGSVLINEQKVFKQTIIRNRSAAPITLELAFAPETDINGLFMAICQVEQQQELTTKIMDQLTNWNDKPVKKKYLANLNRKVTLDANSQAALLLFYAPLQRNIEFQGQIDAKVDDCLDFPGICKVLGSGIGAKLKLTQKMLDMPICMEGSYVISQFQIENSGDMPINYVLTLPPKNLVKRDIVKMFESHVIQIYPQTATVQPGKVLDVQVKFNPPPGFGAKKFTLPNLPVDFIDASGQQQPVGNINISFTCESNKSFSAVETHEVSFQCPARGVEHRTLRIENSTPANFEVKTVLQGPGARHFVVPERLIVPPGGCTFEVQFRPMEVAKAPKSAAPAPAPEAVPSKPESAKGGKKPAEPTPAAPAEVPAHRALLIVASPEGGAIKYELIGVATEPVLDGVVFNKPPAQEEAAPAKGKAPAKGAAPAPQEDPSVSQALHQIDLGDQDVVAYRITSFNVPAYNWEKTMQRFQITFKYDDPAMETLSRFIAPQFIDVSPGANRDVEIKFVPYAIQTFTGLIELTNKKTEQSLKFKFNIACTQNKPIQTHQLETVVRDDVGKQFTLQNVSKQTCTFELKSSTKEITFNKQTLQVLSHQIGVPVGITYLPLLPCQRQEKTIEVEVTNDKGQKMANYIIQVFVTANPPRPGSPVHIRSQVGKAASFQIACKNYSAEKGSLSVAMANVSDVQAIFSYLEQNAGGAAAAKGGKGGPSICDNKTLFPSLNGFQPIAADVSAEANQNYVCNFQFTPQAPGQYQASAVMYGPNVGIWVVPVIGTCDRVAGTGSIAFEQ